MSDLNKKHPSFKFEFKYSQTKIELLDVLAYKDQNNMLQTTIYRNKNGLTRLPLCSIRTPKIAEK